MNPVIFKEDTHQYFLPTEEGWEFELISVSKVLNSVRVYNYAKTEANVAAMSRGSHVHALVEMTDRGSITSADLEDPKEVGYVEGFENFKRDYNYRAIHSEIPYHHPTWMYAGKPDSYGVANIGGNDTLVLLDYKTGSPHPGSFLQLAAYREMLVAHSLTVDAALIVYLTATGKYKVVPQTEHDNDFKVFLSALNVWRWKSRMNLKEMPNDHDPI